METSKLKEKLEKVEMEIATLKEKSQTLNEKLSKKEKEREEILRKIDEENYREISNLIVDAYGDLSEKTFERFRELMKEQKELKELEEETRPDVNETLGEPGILDE